MDFKTEMDKLESIVLKMKDENIELNEAIKLYEEGIKAYEFCKNVLNESNQKIETLSMDSNMEGNIKCQKMNITD